MIKRERRGDYLGKTVQIVPHATDMIQSWLKEVSKIPVDGTGLSPDVCLVEVGGTVGDIESMVFLEAIRQFQFVVGRENILLVHVSLVPAVGGDGEQKSKPTQHSVRELRALGLSPDIIVCRSGKEISLGAKQKISTFCQVPVSNIISVYDVSNIYHVPLILTKQGLPAIIKKSLNLERMTDEPNLTAWSDMAHVVDNLTEKVEIAIVGKYVEMQDSYLSLSKALKHSSIHLKVDIVMKWVEASDLEDGTKATNPQQYESAWEILRTAKGILVPGGFGIRGVEGKIIAAKYARENKVPYLGVCLGMQIMVIEYARHVLGLAKANSAEFEEQSPDPVVIFMPEINQNEMGGTMRLGARSTVIKKVLSTDSKKLSLAAEIYAFDDIENEGENTEIMERHRHRYEINPSYVERLENAGLRFTGTGENGVRMVIAELAAEDHPFYFGTQFHPEFKSRPNRPSPPFFAFAAVAAGRRESLKEAGELWRQHEIALREEIAHIYSPATTTKRKTVEGQEVAMKPPAPVPGSPVAKVRRMV